jgi:hypothetical protein
MHLGDLHPCSQQLSALSTIVHAKRSVAETRHGAFCRGAGSAFSTESAPEQNVARAAKGLPEVQWPVQREGLIRALTRTGLIDSSHPGPNGRVRHGGPRNQWRACREIAARSARKHAATSRRSLIQGCIVLAVPPGITTFVRQVVLEKGIEWRHGMQSSSQSQARDFTPRSTLAKHGGLCLRASHGSE